MSIIDAFLVTVYILEIMGVVAVIGWISYVLSKCIEGSDES